MTALKNHKGSRLYENQQLKDTDFDLYYIHMDMETWWKNGRVLDNSDYEKSLEICSLKRLNGRGQIHAQLKITPPTALVIWIKESDGKNADWRAQYYERSKPQDAAGRKGNTLNRLNA